MTDDEPQHISLTYEIAPEYRNVLQNILWISELLRDTECTPEEVKECADDIHSQYQRLERLIPVLFNEQAD